MDAVGEDTSDVLIVGAGPAGIGVAVVLKRMGINFLLCLEYLLPFFKKVSFFI